MLRRWLGRRELDLGATGLMIPRVEDPVSLPCSRPLHIRLSGIFREWNLTLSLRDWTPRVGSHIISARLDWMIPRVESHVISARQAPRLDSVARWLGGCLGIRWLRSAAVPPVNDRYPTRAEHSSLEDLLHLRDPGIASGTKLAAQKTLHGLVSRYSAHAALQRHCW